MRGEGGEDRKQTRRDSWSDQRTSGRGRFELNLDPGGGGCGGFGYGVLLGGLGIGWEVERVVGVFDEVEGGCSAGGMVRLGPPRTSARLTTKGLGTSLVEDGLELGVVGVFGVAGGLDEEDGDGDVGEVGEGVWQEDAPAVGVDVADEAADVGAWLLGEEEGHDLAAHGASGEE